MCLLRSYETTRKLLTRRSLRNRTIDLGQYALADYCIAYLAVPHRLPSARTPPQTSPPAEPVHRCSLYIFCIRRNADSYPRSAGRCFWVAIRLLPWEVVGVPDGPLLDGAVEMSSQQSLIWVHPRQCTLFGTLTVLRAQQHQARHLPLLAIRSISWKPAPLRHADPRRLSHANDTVLENADHGILDTPI